MCGRYTLRCPDEDALIRGLPFEAFSEVRIEFRPRYNIGPGQRSPIIYLVDGEPVLADAQWGIARTGGGIAVNARSESARTSKAFERAFRVGRCVVPADGFYEWRREGGVNQPYLFEGDDGALFLMAALCEQGRYAILTRDASEDVREIHDRMPVLLARADVVKWLEDGSIGDGIPLAKRPVSRRVNRIGNDDPSCVEAPKQESFEFE